MSNQPEAPQSPAQPQSPPQLPTVPEQAPPLYPVPGPGPTSGLVGSTVWAVPGDVLASPERRPRGWVRTAVRWSVAAGVFLFVAAVTAICVSAPARTDLPGLKTPSDHRYSFPPLKLPPLPPGAVGPNEQKTAGGDQTHAADLRRLLLAGPVGAKPVPGYPGATGWYSPKAYAAKFNDDTELLAEFADDGLRHIAATAWTGPDGTRTEIYLLAYRSDDTASAVFTNDGSNSGPMVAAFAHIVDDLDFPGVDSSSVTAEEQPTTGSFSAADVAFVDCGEVEAVIVMTNPHRVNPVTFTQVVTLQNEMLQG